MRKLRTFYGKVTEFLNDDKITYLQRLREMSESDYIDVPNKLFIYTVRLVIYAKVCQDVVCISQALSFQI